MFFRVFFTHSSDSWPSFGRGLQADSHAPRGVEARGVDQQFLHVPCQGCSKHPPDIVTISYNIYDAVSLSCQQCRTQTFHMQELLFESCIIDQPASVGTILWKKSAIQIDIWNLHQPLSTITKYIGQGSWNCSANTE